MGEAANVNVVLRTAHEHEGAQKQAGDVLNVDGATANWLIAQGIADKPVPSGAVKNGVRGGGSK